MSKSKTLAITAALIFASALLIFLIIYVERSTISTYEQNRPYLTVGDYLKNLSTKAHLWFEEAMAGDETIDIEKDVYGLLNDCLVVLNAAQEGRQTEIGTFVKSNDAETIAVLKESIADVENLLESAKQRWAFKQERDASITHDSTTATTGEMAGGKLDQKFDAAYEELQATFERLVSHVNKKIEADSDFLNSLSWISIVLVTFTLAALCFFVYRILKGNDELTSESKMRLDEEAVRVQTLTGFLEKVSNGNFEMDLDSSNELNSRLIAIRNKLKDNAEQETQRNWATTGLAKIGEILRANYGLASDLYDEVLRFIVKYTNSNQGGMFLVNSDVTNDEHLQMVACYAFERKKHIKKRIDPGEGLVGQCFIEREIIFMTKIPQQYIQITSGLGGATPSSLLVLPLKVNEEIVGVLELASFKSYTPYEIELVQKFAESIASTVSTVRINERTRLLLSQTQQQAEEMRSQEEEMRQNMEEMQATQEEMGRKSNELAKASAEMEGLLRGINSTMATIEFTPDGEVITANDNFLKSMKYALNEIRQRHHKVFVPQEILESDDYKTFWKRLASGKSIAGIFKRISSTGETVWLNAIYNPILNTSGEVAKVVKFATDVTEQQERLAESKGTLEGINATMATIEFLPDGTIVSANENFLKTMRYTLDKIKGKHHKMFAPKEVLESDDYKTFWKRLASGEAITGIFKRVSSTGEAVWLSAIYNPIRNANGEVGKVVKFATDVTKEKEKEAEVHQLLEETRAQEEELRQNMEEMQATQDEMKRQSDQLGNASAEMIGILNGINATMATIEFERDGTIISANDNFLNVMKYTVDKIKGKHHKIFVPKEVLDSEDYKTFWQRLASGEPMTGVVKRISSTGDTVWLNAIYNPILNANGEVVKVVKFATVEKR